MPLFILRPLIRVLLPAPDSPPLGRADILNPARSLRSTTYRGIFNHARCTWYYQLRGNSSGKDTAYRLCSVPRPTESSLLTLPRVSAVLEIEILVLSPLLTSITKKQQQCPLHPPLARRREPGAAPTLLPLLEQLSTAAPLLRTMTTMMMTSMTSMVCTTASGVNYLLPNNRCARLVQRATQACARQARRSRRRFHVHVLRPCRACRRGSWPKRAFWSTRWRSR